MTKAARTEYPLSAINEVFCIVSGREPSAQINLRYLHELVMDVDGFYDDELLNLIC
jgi:hypothetical protein